MAGVFMMVTPFVLSPLGRKLETVANRSLFVRVHPRPSNLGERRAVLRAIQKYGDVEVFKKLAVSHRHPRIQEDWWLTDLACRRKTLHL